MVISPDSNYMRYIVVNTSPIVVLELKKCIGRLSLPPNVHIDVVLQKLRPFLETFSSGPTALVSPGNSLSFMGGGYDRGLAEFLETDYKKLERKIQAQALAKHAGYISPGSVNTIALDSKQYTTLIQAPTMVVPETTTGPIVFDCIWNVMLAAQNSKVENTILPAFGAGYGEIDPAVVARVMTGAIGIFHMPAPAPLARLVAVLFFLGKNYRAFGIPGDIADLEQYVSEHGKKLAGDDCEGPWPMSWEELTLCLNFAEK